MYLYMYMLIINHFSKHESVWVHFKIWWTGEEKRGELVWVVFGTVNNK